MQPQDSNSTSADRRAQAENPVEEQPLAETQPVATKPAENPSAAGQPAAGQRPEEQTPQEPAVAARDAQVRVLLDNGQMKAEVEIDPPEGAGRDVMRADIEDALRAAGVVFGVHEKALVQLSTPLYNIRVVVAEGTAPQDGTDGVCTELFARETKAQYAKRADGSVDYRELGIINDVEAGTVVCEVTPPTDGQDGTNVRGQPVKARNGKKAVVPAGENTAMSADGRRLETTTSGNLVFRSGRFAVEKVYRVQDVDYDVGNITFSGDVQINGDLLDGFEIHAGGNVTLRGRVGAAIVVAGGDISMEQGINGTGKGVVDAGREVKAGFIENCTVRAGVRIVAGSIINSQVECEGDVDVTVKRGIICGGRITAFGSVKANEIGNDFNTLTTITLGVTPKLLKERKRLNDQLNDVSKHIDEMVKNVNYIERLVADGRPVPPERVQVLQRTQLALPMSEKKRDQLQKAIADLEAKMANVSNATLTAKLLHPPTKVSIGALSQNCIETRSNCRVYRSSAGELVFGSF